MIYNQRLRNGILQVNKVIQPNSGERSMNWVLQKSLEDGVPCERAVNSQIKKSKNVGNEESKKKKGKNNRENVAQAMYFYDLRLSGPMSKSEY